MKAKHVTYGIVDVLYYEGNGFFRVQDCRNFQFSVTPERLTFLDK